jgi:hypothetical protein
VRERGIEREMDAGRRGQGQEQWLEEAEMDRCDRTWPNGDEWERGCNGWWWCWWWIGSRSKRECERPGARRGVVCVGGVCLRATNVEGEREAQMT